MPPSWLLMLLAKAEDRFVVAVVVLQGDVDHRCPRRWLCSRPTSLWIGVRPGVEMFDEGLDTARIVEDFRLAIALVRDGNDEPWIQERHFAKALRERFVFQFRHRENLRRRA